MGQREREGLMLYIAGEDISAGSAVVLSSIDGKVYSPGGIVSGEYIGEAAENLREGFRVCLNSDSKVYEDDA